ncbi:VOC family protein [Maribellus mangrovi]|uniref:VOC family protein n=1 Tax=Maribellus mangrovi TaxID=3133146 RepID=UPI0030ED4E41
MRIKSLNIYSTNLSEQVPFYSEVLELPMLESTNESATFQIGESRFTIQHRVQTTPYHFAINIPSNKVDEALGWLQERVSVLNEGDRKIQNFEAWNAKAVYFYDRDKNIVELIARKNLGLNSSNKFDTGSLLSISEIGIPVNNIEKIYAPIHRVTGLEIYDGSFERFCAVGDENGLFICVNKNLKTWFPSGDVAHSSDFSVKIETYNNLYFVEFVNGELKITDKH